LASRKLASAAAHLNARSSHAGRVPPLVLMTDDDRLPDPVAAAKLLPKGAMVIVRSRDDTRRVELSCSLVALGRSRGFVILIANDAELAAHCGADGLHLSQADAHHAAHWRALHPDWFISAAAHSLHAALFCRFVDAIVLSPVFSTASHPERGSLTSVRANKIVLEAVTPVYALGGVAAHNAALLHGFAGIAAIGALAG
jgi:thiamine-phosphate pyrophosphorylase